MITFRKLESVIVGSVNGKPFNVVRTELVEQTLTEFKDSNAPTEVVLEFVKSQRQVQIAQSCKFLVFNPTTKEYFLHYEGNTSEHPIPSTLAKFIEESYDKNIDFLPIVKAWARLLSNPRYNAEMGSLFDAYLGSTYVDYNLVEELVEKEGYTREAAINIATYPDISITDEGLLATYKVADLVTWEYVMEWDDESKAFVKKRNPKYAPIAPTLDPTTGEVLDEGGFVKPDFAEDYLFTPAIHKCGDKFYSDGVLGYVYQVGKTQYLPADAARNLNNTFGGGGLYSGGLEYIRSYRGANNKVLTCFVNPADILSFQSEGRAFRTDALFPNSIMEDDTPLKSIYYSSDYDKLSTERLENLVKEAVAKGTTVLESNKAANKAKELND